MYCRTKGLHVSSSFSPTNSFGFLQLNQPQRVAIRRIFGKWLRITYRSFNELALIFSNSNASNNRVVGKFSGNFLGLETMLANCPSQLNLSLNSYVDIMNRFRFNVIRRAKFFVLLGCYARCVIWRMRHYENLRKIWWSKDRQDQILSIVSYLTTKFLTMKNYIFSRKW